MSTSDITIYELIQLNLNKNISENTNNTDNANNTDNRNNTDNTDNTNNTETNNRLKYILDKLENGFFYLGGQIKMDKNDFITFDLIEKSREMDRQKSLWYDSCPFEKMIGIGHELNLKIIENMLINYHGA